MYVFPNQSTEVETPEVVSHPIETPETNVPKPSPQEIEEVVTAQNQDFAEAQLMVAEDAKDAPVVRKRAMRKCGYFAPLFLIVLGLIIFALVSDCQGKDCPAVVALKVAIGVVSFLILVGLFRMFYNHTYQKESCCYTDYRLRAHQRLRDRLVDSGGFPFVGSDSLFYKMSL